MRLTYAEAAGTRIALSCRMTYPMVMHLERPLDMILPETTLVQDTERHQRAERRVSHWCFAPGQL